MNKRYQIIFIFIIILSSAIMVEAKGDSNNYTKKGIANTSNIFIKKGAWACGLGGGYTSSESDSFSLGLVQGINSLGYSVNVTPFVSYSLADNSSLLVRLKYKRELIRIASGSLDFGDEESGVHLQVKDYYGISQSFNGAVAWRQFIPIGNSKFVSVFVDGIINTGNTITKFAFDSPVKGTFSSTYDFSLNVSPGIMVFVSNHFAVEASVGLAGVTYTKLDQIHNQVNKGSLDSFGTSYSLNLLAMNLAIAFYF